jgi:hypothetical protein
MNKGTTDEYIGRSKGDPWSAWLNANEDADPSSVHIAATSFKKRKVRTEDIDTYWDHNNLEKKARKNRYKASLSLVSIQREHWAAHQQAIADILLAAWTLIALINLLSR